jgi:hypothetical protein
MLFNNNFFKIKFMKLKIYSFLAVFFAAAIIANAQDIAGTYTGLMTVEVVVPEPDEVEFPNQDIIITEEDGGLFKLSILDFSFFGLELGNLEVSGISVIHSFNGWMLSKEGWSDGPAVDLGGGPGSEIPTIIMLNSADITTTGILTLDLRVDLYVDLGTEVLQENVANVTFTGNLSTSGIFSPKAEKIAVYPTVATNIITVEGFENADYSIFNKSGQLVKQGKLTTDAINVSTLNTGLYFLNINGNSAIFIKQ